MGKKKTLTISTFVMAFAMFFACSVPAFAGTTITDGQGTVPVYLTQEATPIDVTIGTDEDPLPTDPSDPDYDPNHPGEVPIDTDGDDRPDVYGPTAEAVYIKGKADSNTASVSDLVVKNNMSSNPVYVKGIIINNVTSGYNLAPYTDNYATKQADSKAFGVAINKIGGTTQATAIDLKTGYTKAAGDAVAAEDSLTYDLVGKVAATTQAINLVKVADCVLTLDITSE